MPKPVTLKDARQVLSQQDWPCLPSPVCSTPKSVPSCHAVAPEEMLGQAYGLGRGQESATLFGPYPSTPRVHAPAAPNVQQDPPTPATPTPAVPTSAGGQTGAAMGAAGQAGDQAGSASGAQPGQFSDGVKRGPPLADGQRRSEGDASVPGVSQSEFLNFCRQA